LGTARRRVIFERIADISMRDKGERGGSVFWWEILVSIWKREVDPFTGRKKGFTCQSLRGKKRESNCVPAFSRKKKALSKKEGAETGKEEDVVRGGFNLQPVSFKGG